MLSTSRVRLGCGLIGREGTRRRKVEHDRLDESSRDHV
jgi:hypothetical protein